MKDIVKKSLSKYYKQTFKHSTQNNDINAYPIYLEQEKQENQPRRL